MPKKLENEVKEEKTKKTTVKKGKATETQKVEKIKKSKISTEKEKEPVKKATKKVAVTEKKEATKKATSKKTTVEKATVKKESTKKATASKKTTGSKTASTKKTTSKKSTAKKSTTTKKSTTKKTTKKVKSPEISEVKKPEFLQEYYDLPYRYNETIVTILAQTPKRLFVYWDISDSDREAYRRAFGDDFFEKTYPVLLVHNEELNYTFEVPINDFANSWYLDIKDSKKNYVVQLGRKFRNTEQAKSVDFGRVQQEHINLQNDFIYITDSNKLEAPNDHILFELLTNLVRYRNVKTGEEYTKDLREILGDLANIYPQDAIHDLYTKLYSNEMAYEDFGRKNPASGEFGLPGSSGSLRSSGAW